MTQFISILGSTGSIGTQALQVCEALGVQPVALAAKRNIGLLEAQARRWKPKLVAVYDEAAAKQLKISLADTAIRVYSGEQGLVEAACVPGATMTLTSVVGMVGLLPTLAAIDCGRDIALANKETLVCAGELVTRRAKEKGVRILPVDSEHSAIFQCLQGARDAGQIQKLILTASGGPFFAWSPAALQGVTREQALCHPNWDMGNKITIDSATLMNKGLEFIEAMWLFQVPPQKISVVIHRESILHSAICYVDGSVIGQMGVPDMRLPIAYALTYPERRDFGGPALDLAHTPALTFAEPDMQAFRCLPLAIAAARRGGLSAAVLNGANEAAVELFLQEKIGFCRIAELVEGAMDTIDGSGPVTLENVLAADAAARAQVYERA